MGNKHSGKEDDATRQLSESQIELIMQNTAFEKNEISEWYQGFLKECPEGKLTYKQLNNVYKKLFPGKADKYSQAVFNAFDKGDIRKRLALSFRIFDTSRQGKISLKDLEKIIDTIYNLKDVPKSKRTAENSPSERAKQVMSQFDKNADNYLNEEEFVSGCLSNPFLKSILIPEY